jgi:hypothetical protein
VLFSWIHFLSFQELIQKKHESSIDPKYWWLLTPVGEAAIETVEVMGYIAPSHKHEASNSNSYSSSSFEKNYISQMEEGYSKYIKVKLRTPHMPRLPDIPSYKSLLYFKLLHTY